MPTAACLQGHAWENWEWDSEGKSPDALLSPCRQAVYFHINPLLESQGTAGVRGTKGFCHGEHYWEIEFLEPPYGTSVMVGVGTEKALLHAGDKQFINLLGADGESWGLSYKGSLWHNGKSRKYTEPFYDKTTVIGVLLDLDAGTLRFFRNGANLGLAFSGLDEVGCALYPLVSSTAPDTELLLGVRTSRLHSLQERCLHTIAQSLRPLATLQPLDTLPLPSALLFQLHNHTTHHTHPPHNTTAQTNLTLPKHATQPQHTPPKPATETHHKLPKSTTQPGLC
ncbi:SPRY domain-containing SOCS box protein 3 [Chanos chanos]|uniref:SPRY domain-containing SOCS box protein 3 n=1 Tax=Chanos chanos TaxID=29144 RepID=A0A6J2X1S9_CHACN|nr:SPRY domain-containing SOCS box protein 3-like [Chanos chanos]XP_030650357.1 SPRY domain-containing SOCS box protein 3-like [Chanos chanos]